MLKKHWAVRMTIEKPKLGQVQIGLVRDFNIDKLTEILRHAGLINICQDETLLNGDTGDLIIDLLPQTM